MIGLKTDNDLPIYIYTRIVANISSYQPSTSGNLSLLVLESAVFEC